MYRILFLVFMTSCAQVKTETKVSLNAAVNHAHASYLKGCVDAHRDLNIPASFPRCRDKAHLHRQELEQFMEMEPVINY